MESSLSAFVLFARNFWCAPRGVFSEGWLRSHAPVSTTIVFSSFFFPSYPGLPLLLRRPVSRDSLGWISIYVPRKWFEEGPCKFDRSVLWPRILLLRKDVFIGGRFINVVNFSLSVVKYIIFQLARIKKKDMRNCKTVRGWDWSGKFLIWENIGRNEILIEKSVPLWKNTAKLISISKKDWITLFIIPLVVYNNSILKTINIYKLL